MMHFMPRFQADLQPLHNAGWVTPHASCQQVLFLFFILIPLKLLLVKIEPYCSSECIYSCHFWTAFGHHLVKMGPRALTLQIDGNEKGLASLKFQNWNEVFLIYVHIYLFFLTTWVLMWLKGEVKPTLHLQGAFSKIISPTEPERDQCHLLQPHRCENIYRCRVANNNLAQIMSLLERKIPFHWAWNKCCGLETSMDFAQMSWLMGLASDGSHHQPCTTPKP